MIKKLVKLANNLDRRGLFKEADRLDSIIRFAAANRLFGFKEDSFRRGDGIAGPSNAMLKLSELVADRINLHTPMFLGRGMSAYAFSASNDDGENVVMKIMPESEAANYEMLMNNKSIQTSIMPVIYRVEKLKDLNLEELNPELFESLRDIIYDSSVVVMEELEPMPPQLVQVITENFDTKENFRLFIQSDEYRNMKKTFIEDVSKELSNRFELDNKIISNIIDKCLAAFRVLNEDNYTRVSHLILKFIDKMEKTIDDLNYEDEVFQRNRELILMKINEKQEDFIYKLNEIVYENWFALDRLKYLDVRGKGDIIKELDKLKELGVDPLDVHRNNIMIRPDTGEFVIGDIGSFHIDEASS